MNKAKIGVIGAFVDIYLGKKVINHGNVENRS